MAKSVEEAHREIREFVAGAANRARDYLEEARQGQSRGPHSPESRLFVLRGWEYRALAVLERSTDTFVVLGSEESSGLIQFRTLLAIEEPAKLVSEAFIDEATETLLAELRDLAKV